MDGQMLTQQEIDERIFDLYDEYCHGRIDRHAGLVENGAAGEIHILDAGKVEPLIPILPIVDVQELDLVEVGRPAQGTTALEQLWTADGKELLRAEAGDVKPRFISVAVTNRKVDVLAREVDVLQ